MNKPVLTLTYGLGITEAFIMGFAIAQKYFCPGHRKWDIDFNHRLFPCM